MRFLLRGRLKHKNIFPENSKDELEKYIAQAIREECILVDSSDSGTIYGVIVGKSYPAECKYYIAGLYAIRKQSLCNFVRWLSFNDDRKHWRIEARRHGRIITYPARFLTRINQFYG